MAGKYKWRDGCRLRGSANSVGLELERIREDHGELTPNVVVEEASAPGSPLHCYFEWDDTAAADEYRKHQARNLICSVVVTYRKGNNKREVRGFLSLENGENPGRAYHPVEEAMTSAAMRARLVDRALRDAELWKMRYDRLVELAEIFEAIERTRRKKKGR